MVRHYNYLLAGTTVVALTIPLAGAARTVPSTAWQQYDRALDRPCRGEDKLP
jgi:hypothetical protein